ncbi:MAG: hypothetical protein KDI17_09185 [Halioglobus sp.]|nr:hypothetical protein [Halioglobus sp.]
MKLFLQQFSNGMRLILLSSVWITGTQATAAPVDSRSHNCTFVNAVVSEAEVFGSGTDGGIAIAASPASSVPIPGRAVAPSGCDLVRFSSETVAVGGSGYRGSTTQAFLQMATIFDGQQEADFDLVSIFDFLLPQSGLATLEERLPRVRAGAGGQILGH